MEAALKHLIRIIKRYTLQSACYYNRRKKFSTLDLRVKILSGAEKTPTYHSMKLVFSRITSDSHATKSNR